jgi:filamentous hemagglutinin family protein
VKIHRFALALSAALLEALAAEAASEGAELPVPCVAGSCGAGIPGFVQSGQAGATQSGSTLTIQQSTDRAVLNWASFNVSSDGRVVFKQPDSGSIALNRIHQESPSRIFGAVEANGQIYLVNQNGIVFGATSQVKTAGLLASTLNISDAVFESGILAPELLQNRRPALESDGRTGIVDRNGTLILGADGKPQPVKLAVESGARITTTQNGARLLLASQSVDNAGKLDAPSGQVVLAAGEKVYLQASTDPTLRGLIVEVDSGGEAWNRLTGDISSAQGNVTIAGLAVNQLGRVSATTTVSANGSIRLVGRDTVSISNAGRGPELSATRGGTVQLGAGSVTQVTPDLADTTTGIDEQAQNPSTILVSGRQITLRSNSLVKATGGRVDILAQQNPNTPVPSDADSRIRVESGASIDVSGSIAVVPVTQNLVSVELRANELRDSPLQRDGALRGKTVIVDARVGTPLADVSGAIAGIQRGIAERTSAGGTVSMISQGDIAVAQGASVNVSGGRIDYQGGVMQTTQLIAANGKVVDIGQASATTLYTGLINPTTTRSFDRWGVVETVAGPAVGQFEAGYSSGKSAGTLQFAAPNMVLDGVFSGSAYIGATQRLPAQIPAGGRLVLGVPGAIDPSIADYRAPSIALVRSSGSTPVSSDTPLLGPRTLEFSVSPLTDGGFRALDIYSNGVVTLADKTDLALAPGTRLSVTARQVDIRSSISTPGGTVQLLTDQTAGLPGVTLARPGISIGDGVAIDVSGTWQNDFAGPLGPVYRNGGTIDLIAKSFLSVASGLALGAGSQLLANGGAWLQTGGAITPGSGGRIALRSGQFDSAFSVGSNVQLAAFAAQGAQGGTFTLEAGSIDIGKGAVWAAPQAYDPTAAKPAQALQLGDGLFSSYGFSTFNLTATGPISGAGLPYTLRVLAGSSIDSTASVAQLNGTASDLPSARNIAAISQIVRPPDYLLNPSSVSFRVDPRDFFGSANVGQLVVQSGASITAPARSTFSFSSPAGILLAGQVRAPSGVISASLPTPALAIDEGYQQGLAIEVADTAVLDAGGVAILRPSDTGLVAGEVLAGGSINLVADRGSVFIRPDARLRIAGAAADLDLRVGTSGASYLRQSVASAAGTLTVRAPESIVFAGAIDAHAGVGSARAAAGGTLLLQLARDRGFLTGDSTLAATYPTNPRTIRVIPDVFGAGPSFPDGLSVVEARRLAASGFDAVTLESDGRVALDSGVALALGRRLTLDTPVIDVTPGARVTLAAPYIAIGSSVPRAVDRTVQPGTGTLDVRADLVDLVGQSVIQRTAGTSITSSGDIRLRGVEQNSTSTGALNLGGTLDLVAQRIYPTTESSFSITIAGGDVNWLTIGRPTGDVNTTVPLSAGGSVQLTAEKIVQGGILLAPFGAIALSGSTSVSLLPSSITSVSAQSTTIPFGRVELGQDWIYDVGVTSVVQTGIPDRRVTFSGDNLQIATGSTIDLRGGGDLYAYSWLPGSGGSKDALAPGVVPGLYAVMPTMRGQFSPYDPQLSFGSDLRPGDSVYLSGGNGLAAGVYPLLPARYALQPGAYLVRAVSGYTDLQPGTAATLADGTAVVAGYRTFAGTGLGDTRYSGFSLVPGSDARKLAAYDDFLASTFFLARADRLELPAPAVPADAGYLGLFPQSTLVARGDVLSAAAAGGRGATIDIAAARLEVTAALNAASAAVQIETASLTHWNPASLLLGGRRSASDGAVQDIDVLADSVTFLPGSSLTLDEVLTVARKTISVAAGSRVASSASSASSPANSNVLGQRTLHLQDDGGSSASALGVSNFSALSVTRDVAARASAAGTVDTAAGSTIESHRTLLLDAPGGGRLAGNIEGAGAQWTLGSQRIAFATPFIADGLAISSTLLASLQKAAGVALTSSGAIDFLGSVDFGAGLGTLQLTASSLRSLGLEAVVNLAARNISLRGIGPATAPAAAATSGSLSLSGGSIDLAGGALDVAGFASTRLQAAGDIRTSGVATLRSPADVELAAARISTAAGADGSFESGGRLTVTSVAGAGGALPAAGIGGTLGFSGQAVQIAGRVELPSGSIAIRSNSTIDLAAGSTLDTSGLSIAVADRVVGSPGGAVSLVAASNVVLAPSASISVAAGDQQDGGTLSIKAGGSADLRGSLSGTASDASRGAGFVLDAGSLPSLADLNARLQGGGFAGQRSIRVRTGDLDLPAGTTMAAHDVQLTADAGQVRIGGNILIGSANQRSLLDLFGGTGVSVLGGAELRARGLGDAGRGGLITIGSASGSVNLAQGSIIDTNGAAGGGSLRIRAPSLATDVAIGTLGATFRGVGAVVLEPVLSFADVPGTLDAAALAPYQAASASYIAAAGPNILQRLAGSGTPPVSVQPGIDLLRTGDLSIGPVNFSNWRFAGSPAALNFRATGSIVVSGNVSDGFVDSGAGANARTDLLSDASSTLRLVAGASLTSPDPLALGGAAASDITIADAVIRTGTGSLDLVAARDIVFSGARASAYTGGLPGATAISVPRGPLITFPTLGGNLQLAAGRDVIGSAVTQAVGDWQPRQGRNDGTAQSPVRWGVNIRPFAWNAGTLGGGDLRVFGGRDVTDLSAAAADSAVELTPGQLTSFNGGQLAISAGRDVNSAFLHASSGFNTIDAVRSLGRSRTGTSGELLGTLLSIENARFDISAGRDIALESAFNPTLLAQPGATLVLRSYFSTFGAQSALSAQSTAGTVSISADADRLVSFLGTAAVSANSAAALALLPPDVRLWALTRDVALAGSLTMFPSNTGNLDILAARDVASAQASLLTMSDTAASSIPLPLRAAIDAASIAEIQRRTGGLRHANDAQPVLITAGRDISGGTFALPKLARTVAARDIANFTLQNQNLGSNDHTLVSAGRDVRYSNGFTVGEITVGGTGFLDLLAGRDLDLAFSQGITTSGRLLNASLPVSGADISVFAGLSQAFDVSSFLANVVAPVVDYQSDLIGFVRQVTGKAYGAFAAALQAFKLLQREQQLPFVTSTFFKELVKAGRDANSDPGSNFKRGYAAIATLFPGSPVAAPVGAGSDPYAGDIRLAFSRIYTLGGGNIALLVPGGLVDVGLATPPAVGAPVRGPSDLGIVAQRAGDVRIFSSGDVLVNQSRVFTLGGGNIAIWSTKGDIDAGRGAKTAISAPAPNVIVDGSGNVVVDFAGAVAGSGIRAIVTDPTVRPGDVDLIAPSGTVNAGDAGIGSAGNLNIAAQQVVGLDNIQVGGSSSGVPAETSNLGASLSGASGVAASSSAASGNAVSTGNATTQAAPLAQSALGWLDVFVEGFGEEVCKPNDTECLNRNRKP